MSKSSRRLLMIIGASGNLSQNKLIPIIIEKKLYLDAEIVLYSRHFPETDIFKKVRSLEDGNIRIVQRDYTDKEKMLEILDDKVDPIVYFALPSRVHLQTLKILEALDKKILVLIDKPHFTSFEDVQEAIKLKNITTYLIDHFILKKTILLWELLPKEMKEKLLVADKIKRFKCISTESITAQNRISFNNDGIIKDMITSHQFALYDILLPEKGIENLKPRPKKLLGQYEDYEFENSSTVTFSHLVFDSSFGHQVDFIAGKALSEKKTSIEIVMETGTLELQIFPETKIFFNKEPVDDSDAQKKLLEKYNSHQDYSLILYSALKNKSIPTIPIKSVLFRYKIEDEIEKANNPIFIYKKGEELENIENKIFEE